jgi:hypothetical protein
LIDLHFFCEVDEQSPFAGIEDSTGVVHRGRQEGVFDGEVNIEARMFSSLEIDDSVMEFSFLLFHFFISRKTDQAVQRRNVEMGWIAMTSSGGRFST